MTARACSEGGCDKPARRRGLCNKHSQQFRKSEHFAPLPKLSAEERFWSKVDKAGPIPAHRPELGPCWVWTRATNGRGYGAFGVAKGCTVKAHTFAYELLVGPVPEGLEPDHLCRNRACVRPTHLEAVTHEENVRRGSSPPALNAAKERCLNDHPFDDANTYIAHGQRYCRPCRAARQREYNARKKAAA